MKELPKINIEDFNYDLPEDRIAQHPEKYRDTSKLLLCKNGNISEDIFRNIDKHLPGDSLLVFNNTRVIRARLLFKKESGANVEVLCLEPMAPADYQQSLASTSPVEWKCIIGNLKKWKNGKLSKAFFINGTEYELSALRIKEEGEAWRVRFTWSTNEISFGELIQNTGHIPLPPYIRREDEDEDNVRYQTVYSSIEGSVAAPTAGLHFTDVLLNNIRKRGIRSAEITLHVGAGTFQPVRTDNIARHEMHCEHFYFDAEVLESLLRSQGKIIAAGTTSVRTLESIYWLGVKIIRGRIQPVTGLSVEQWDPYNGDKEISLADSLSELLRYIKSCNMLIIPATTRLMIVPGYRFRVIDGMITNFHQPKSTLLLLVSAWAGKKWEEIYSYALMNNFRFLSYGDASLLLR